MEDVVTARIAKKVERRMRQSYGAHGIYRGTTIRTAARRYSRLWGRFCNAWRSRTPGGRWGKWDATMPCDPNEIPF